MFSDKYVIQNKIFSFEIKLQAKSVFLSNVKKTVGISLDKVLFSAEKYLYFSYFLMKTYVVDTH